MYLKISEGIYQALYNIEKIIELKTFNSVKISKYIRIHLMDFDIFIFFLILVKTETKWI